MFTLSSLACVHHVSCHRYQAGALARQSYLPFKVNATGVMPLIFASSLLGLPLALARYTDSATVDNIARSLGPQGPLYLPVNIALIAFFNYYYTFLQVSLSNALCYPRKCSLGGSAHVVAVLLAADMMRMLLLAGAML